ncbi:UvrD-helicase domain-containing protein [Thermodesulfovibrio yellowstonii]|uniref:UvrD-helicase domain-containing protein n=1 Tax=Thermodesulfovibrio yellowstonii TaxID=28262 RepID=UPI0004215250|nr:UvrD-helicase domain-containing protein [Thermodesulfovibrio islandicus]
MKQEQFTLTEEQKEVLNETFNSEVVLVNALAGTGKTTTCFEIIKESLSRGLRVLYLVFNKAMQQEAALKANALKLDRDKRFEIKTVHALAYKHLARTGFFRNYQVGNIRAKDLHDEYHLPYNTSFFLLKLFNEFLYSEHTTETLRDFFDALRTESAFWDSVIEEHRLYPEHLRSLIQDIEDRVFPCPHDFYLKKFIELLCNKSLYCNYDVVILDEAQDTNPCFVSLLKAMHSRHKVMVGDRHQWIYAFRGSVNLMEEFTNAKRLYLTTTFRFADEIAESANVLLKFKGERHLLRTKKSKQARKTRAYISRTNAKLLEHYLSLSDVLKERVIFERGIEEIVRLPLTVALILENKNPYSFCSIHNLKPGAVVDESFYRAFTDREQLEDYVRELEELNSSGSDRVTEAEVVTSYRLADKYRARDFVEFLNMYNRIQPELFDEPDLAVYLSTAHSAKGQEYKQVVLLNDFSLLLDEETYNGLMSVTEEDVTDEHRKELKKDLRGKIPEINLLYVALTRASETLTLSGSVVKNLELCKKLTELGITLKKEKAEEKESKDKKEELNYATA